MSGKDFTKLIEHAKRLIDQGFAVFPCYQNKKPATENGFKDATASLREFRRLLAKCKDKPTLIGIPTSSDRPVIDCDSYKKFASDADQIAHEQFLERHQSALFNTRIVTTQSGGRHYYFANLSEEEFRNSTSKLAPGIDVRGDGGYVIAAGEGYEVANDTGIAQLPESLKNELLAIQRERPSEAVQGELQEGDANTSAQVAGSNVVPIASSQIAKEGTRNDQLYRWGINYYVRNQGNITLMQLYRHLIETNNTQCETPLPELEVKQIAQSVFDSNAAQDARAKANAGTSTQLQSSVPGNQSDTGQSSEPEAFSVGFDDYLSSPLEGNQYLIKGWIPAGDTGFLIGGSGRFKTFAALEMAHCIANGRSFGGQPVREPKRVLFVIGEGQRGFKKRYQALCKQHGRTNNIGLVLDKMDLSEPKDLTRLSLTVAETKPALIVADTFSTLAGDTDENSNRDVAKLLTQLQWIAAQVGSGLLIVHHTGKDESKGARGASALLANCDFMMQVDRADGEMSVELSCKKSKDGEPPKPITLKMDKVKLGTDEDGDDIDSLVVVDSSGNSVSKLPRKDIDAYSVFTALRECNTQIEDKYKLTGTEPVNGKPYRGCHWVLLTEAKAWLAEWGYMLSDDGKWSRNDNRKFTEAVKALEQDRKIVTGEKKHKGSKVRLRSLSCRVNPGFRK